MSINLRIFRQPTKDIQPNGDFHIDKLQMQFVHVIKQQTDRGIFGIESEVIKKSDWVDVPIVEADSY